MKIFVYCLQKISIMCMRASATMCVSLTGQLDLEHHGSSLQVFEAKGSYD